ncbi:MAG: DUF1540 domain-containing protein [Oscillospiraceae bacterium]|nr:DUF1540 domain-containing protein [Oscillospiraceae bacterium]
MSDNRMSRDQITGVGCDVSNCKYNTIDSKCSASHIDVQNERATTKSETYCATFCPRGCCD